MEEFRQTLHSVKRDGVSFDDLNQVSTKKKKCIVEKLQLLEDFMYKFLHISYEGAKEIDVLDFIKENINSEAISEDVDLYNDMLEDLSLNVNNDTILLDRHNRPSLIAIIGYACEMDIDLDDWFIQYFKSHSTYIKDQKKNFLQMVKDLQAYVAHNKKASA